MVVPPGDLYIELVLPSSKQKCDTVVLLGARFKFSKITDTKQVVEAALHQIRYYKDHSASISRPSLGMDREDQFTCAAHS